MTYPSPAALFRRAALLAALAFASFLLSSSRALSRFFCLALRSRCSRDLSPLRNDIATPRSDGTAFPGLVPRFAAGFDMGGSIPQACLCLNRRVRAVNPDQGPGHCWSWFYIFDQEGRSDRNPGMRV